MNGDVFFVSDLVVFIFEKWYKFTFAFTTFFCFIKITQQLNFPWFMFQCQLHCRLIYRFEFGFRAYNRYSVFATQLIAYRSVVLHCFFIVVIFPAGYHIAGVYDYVIVQMFFVNVSADNYLIIRKTKFSVFHPKAMNSFGCYIIVRCKWLNKMMWNNPIILIKRQTQ